MKYSIVALVLLLCACGGSSDVYSDATERSIDSIFQDIKSKKFDKDVPIIEVVSHDMCDCLDKVNIKRIVVAQDSLNAGTKSPDDIGKDVDLAFNKMGQCQNIWTGRLYGEHYIGMGNGLDGVDTLYAIPVLKLMKEKCPVLLNQWDKIITKGQGESFFESLLKLPN
jgi:hypothetical protein